VSFNNILKEVTVIEYLKRIPEFLVRQIDRRFSIMTIRYSNNNNYNVRIYYHGMFYIFVVIPIYGSYPTRKIRVGNSRECRKYIQ